MIANNDHVPTYFGPNSCDVLDLALVSQRVWNQISEVEIKDPLSNSDHCCVSIQLNMALSKDVDGETNRSFDFKRADWNLYQVQMHAMLQGSGLSQESVFDPSQSIDSITESIEEFAARLNSVISIVSNAVLPVKNKTNERVSLPPETLQLIQERRRLLRLRRRLIKNQGVTDQALNRTINRLTREINQKVIERKRSVWQQHTASLNFRESQKLWRTIKSLNDRQDPKPKQLPAIRYDPADPNKKAKTSVEKAEVLSKHLATVFKDQESPTFYKQWPKIVEMFVKINPNHYKPVHPNTSDRSNTPEYAQYITANEIRCSMRFMRNKAPGCDGVYIVMLKNGPDLLHETLAKLFNACLAVGYHPKLWKVAVVSMIAKPGKDPTLPSGYRPISLLSVVGKLLERIMTHRLLKHLEENRQLNRFQSGFRKKRSTTDHLFRLTQTVSQGFNQNMSTVCVFLDVEKAFDCVWLDGLRWKLKREFNLDSILTRWISSYLSDRQVCVKVNGRCSNAFVPTAGVPQGSVIAPVLFNMFANEMPLGGQGTCSSSQFADDIALWATAENIHEAATNVQQMLNKVATYCNKWKIKLNADKTQCVIFTKSGRWNRTFGPNKQPIKLLLNGQDVNPTREAKFLGVTFDSALCFDTHVKNVVTKCRRRLNVLKALRGSDWGADTSLILGVYQQFIRPVLLYGSIAFCRASKTQVLKLQRIENNALRIAMRLPVYTPTEWLHQNANMPYLPNMWAKECLCYFKKVLISDEPSMLLMQDFVLENVRNFDRFGRYQTPLGFVIDTCNQLL